MKARVQEAYGGAHREVRRSVRRDKRVYINNLAKAAEEAAEKRNMKDLYSCAKKLAGNHHRIQKPVKDKHGKPLTTAEDQLKCRAEHFGELLNRPAPLDLPNISPSDTVLPLNCNKPSKSEIRATILASKNGKAAGPDGVPAEALKVDMSTSLDILYRLFVRIWEEESIPEEWQKGIIVKVPKKGDLGYCNNHRGIMLLSVPGKVLNRILLERMKTAVDIMLRDQQAGFRKDRSCIDQICTLRVIIEQSLECFDSVDRETLWKFYDPMEFQRNWLPS